MSPLLTLAFTCSLSIRATTTNGGPLTTSFNRRALFALLPSSAFVLAMPKAIAASAGLDKAGLILELRDVADRLKPLPALLDQEKWDSVRTVLKNPPVANLWNLGMGRNTIKKLASACGDDEAIAEYIEEVAGALQLADQFTYDNVFVYTQPGSGKVKTKEPKDQLKLAMRQINEVIDLASK